MASGKRSHIRQPTDHQRAKATADNAAAKLKRYPTAPVYKQPKFGAKGRI